MWSFEVFFVCLFSGGSKREEAMSRAKKHPCPPLSVLMKKWERRKKRPGTKSQGGAT
jgi:hypothetical protein